MHRLPVISDRKHPQPDYYIAEWVGRSADKYETYNAKVPKVRRRKPSGEPAR